MKSPYAILIGLALIAAAIFYREPSVPTALAGTIKTKYMDGFKCLSPAEGVTSCAILHGNQITYNLWAVAPNPKDNTMKDVFIKKTYKWQ